MNELPEIQPEATFHLVDRPQLFECEEALLLVGITVDFLDADAGSMSTRQRTTP
jgi:hypothetical protein